MLGLLRTGLIALALAMPTSYAAAKADVETVEACATYVNSGKKYKVEAHVMSGSELNRVTSSFKYSSFDKYVVIFWGPGEASIIKLKFAPFGIGIFDTDGEDQRGYAWKLSTSTLACF